ncbi:hypothetical protein N7373_05495 [Achromobacter mucicolens]|uniref:hypothetical protein n=1 Tax=Achromobacter mucicolens TaxID=1389922 RepID=UPI00244883BE|nr:hypothetical protein [Achromobacter mucicolens]MDH0090895.1 hypothetical protein [Achromobacter mucicolens]
MFNLARPRRACWPLLFGLLTGLAAPLLAAAQSAAEHIVPVPPPAPPAHLVRELLEEDAQRALATERRSGSMQGTAALPAGANLPATVSASSPPAPAPAPTKPTVNARLKGIVGVGGQLSAIVQIDGQDVLYRAGQPLPATGRDTGLRLVKIATPCVQFVDHRHDTETETDTETSISVCLNEDHP